VSGEQQAWGRCTAHGPRTSARRRRRPAWISAATWHAPAVAGIDRTGDRAFAPARQRLDRALAALGHFAAEEVIVSTLPRGLSAWLHRDLPARLRKAHGIPVTHLDAAGNGART
jgi:hypothetical protein